MRMPPRILRRHILTATAITTATVAVGAACSSPQPEVVGSAQVSTQDGTARAAQLTYDFGDTAYAPPGLDGKRMELKAAVTYPRKLDGGKHPVVMMLHGWGDTCAKADKPVRSQDWPCSKDAKSVDNYLGYSYLAEALADKGYIVVSVAANGIQAQEKDDGHTARAALLDKHLKMWQQLGTGEGPLRELKQFTNHVDLNRVGTLGHSRGGGGVLAQALDSHKRPPGVNIRGTLALAPAMNGISADKERITRIPLSVVAGTCDAMWKDSKIPVAMASGNPNVEHHDVPGGNHNFFNTVWTPGTGPAFATDDVAVDKRNRPGGKCQSTNGTGTIQQLKPSEQRETAIRYVTAFFDKYVR
ncbi:alpha/beta hydrolase family protein [Streptomyces sp. NRRL F-5755]|uniref:alpha/beta hydrolase family protein n=1 Tax=Streptomyces sp. NRRL F-5755 TaxID=1519475 RepID=UPI0006AECFD8|nr:alpha/beta hydrolase [Streptomyces sp. NRRL F-5755]